MGTDYFAAVRVPGVPGTSPVSGDGANPHKHCMSPVSPVSPVENTNTAGSAPEAEAADVANTPPKGATGDDAADWTTMVDGVRDCLRGHGVEIGPVIDRLTSDELTDWRSGWFGPAEVRAFAGVAVANRLAGACRLLVRCTDCRHFERHEWHPHLGACAMHERPPGAAGLWDDDLRACTRFDPYRGKGPRDIVTPGPCPAVTTRNEAHK